MYYHNSPTAKQLKAIKYAKAVEMKTHLDAMTQVTAKYKDTLKLLEKLRGIELYLSNEISTGRLEGQLLSDAQAVLEQNRRKAARLVKKLLPDFTLDD